MGSSIFGVLFVIGLILGMTEFRRFNSRITLWFSEEIPFFEKINIPLASLLFVIGLIGLMMNW